VKEVVIYRKLETPKEYKTNKGQLKATASGFLDYSFCVPDIIISLTQLNI
jgi:hypothetical protein